MLAKFKGYIFPIVNLKYNTLLKSLVKNRQFTAHQNQVSNNCFSARNKSELFARANCIGFCRFPQASIVRSIVRFFCFQRYVNRVAHPVLHSVAFFQRTENIFRILLSRFLKVAITAYRCTSLATPQKSLTSATIMQARRLLLRRLGLFVSVGVHIYRKAPHDAVHPANTCVETRLKIRKL